MSPNVVFTVYLTYHFEFFISHIVKFYSFPLVFILYLALLLKKSKFSWESVTVFLLIYSTKQCPSWEGNTFEVNQENHYILWNSNIHYRITKFTSPVPILRMVGLVHKPTLHFQMIRLIIIIPSTPVYPKFSFPSGFPLKPCSGFSYPPYALHSQAISFISILSTDKFWVRITHHYAPHNLASSTPQYIVPLRSYIFTLVPFCRTPFAKVPLKFNDQVPHSYITTTNFIIPFLYL
jgi:hypothetical protein